MDGLQGRVQASYTSIGASRAIGLSQQITPGTFVSHPDRPDWGIGQVQSAVGNRVTVNFEHAGKRLINSDHVQLDTVDREDRPAR
jgi:hypothetical protein